MDCCSRSYNYGLARQVFEVLYIRVSHALSVPSCDMIQRYMDNLRTMPGTYLTLLEFPIYNGKYFHVFVISHSEWPQEPMICFYYHSPIYLDLSLATSKNGGSTISSYQHCSSYYWITASFVTTLSTFHLLIDQSLRDLALFYFRCRNAPQRNDA